MPWGKQTAITTIQCSLIKAPIIYIEPVPRSKIQLLMDEYPSQEWLAHLRGKIKGSDIFVEDISVPPHDYANGASADGRTVKSYDPEKGYKFYEPEDCVGIIHSHHHMGAFHSGTDQSYVDKNYPVSITVAFNGSKELVFDAVSFQITPCKKGTTLKAVVKYIQPQPLFDTKSFIEEAKGNIDKSKQVITYSPQQSFIPLRFRKDLPYSDYTDYVTDDKGNVLSKKELADILKGIYKD